MEFHYYYFVGLMIIFNCLIKHIAFVTVFGIIAYAVLFLIMYIINIITKS